MHMIADSHNPVLPIKYQHLPVKRPENALELNLEKDWHISMKTHYR